MEAELQAKWMVAPVVVAVVVLAEQTHYQSLACGHHEPDWLVYSQNFSWFVTNH
jgi:hypothetical protein